MVEITTSTSSRSKRRSLPHLDMPPLADLGFLLTTFFMLTTHLIDQWVMNLEFPLPGKATSANNTFTILLDEEGRRYGYQGEFSAATLLHPLGGKALRNTLNSFRAISVQAEHEPVYIVNENDGLSYQLVVTAIDEFSIADSITYDERMLPVSMQTD